MLEEALEHLVKGIVTNSDDVQVRARRLRKGKVLEVRVHPEDLGKVIGRNGRTAKALRTASVRWPGDVMSASTCWTCTKCADCRPGAGPRPGPPPGNTARCVP
ncbi:putative RNA-binding protein YlqC (UPF0109 family) [Haloactinospora alba]|uniref:RNA-binding protein KhpA n=1 Tax=Haloactinospora alba TaxID=405555 RepID=A0A543NFZ5_9ACTN|nr:putative RNA-binding protein YlqC (UPF0109 family) [Haloactinospora alba]